MTSSRDLDGRVAQGWGGTSPNGIHVNVVLARRGTPTAAAITAAYAAPSAGFTPILACAGKDQRSYETILPITVLLPKVAPQSAFGQTLLSGAVQVGAGQAVLDLAHEGTIVADQEHLILVSIWLDPAADDEGDVRSAAREAVRAALREAVVGRDNSAVARLIASRESLDHPFYLADH